MTLPLTEVFGPTLQGEGPAAGRNSAFLRLGGCNLSCTWCDSPYTWDGARYDLRSEITATSVPDIMAQLPDAPTIVVTGGEPLLYQHTPGWHALLVELLARYRWLHLETNGTIAPTAETRAAFTLISVSPKQPHAGFHRGRQNPTMWQGWHEVPQAFLKVVCQTELDVLDAADMARGHGFDAHRIWVMPEGYELDVLTERWPSIAAAAAKHGINATHRLHILAWRDERGH